MNKGLMEYRSVFILLIFLYHAGVLPMGGTFGVAAFFILGGFCTALAYRERVSDKLFDYKGYLKRRLSKYYPLHWLLLIPAFVSELFTGFTLVKSSLILLVNLLLLQSFIPVKEVFFSYNAVSWYLSDTIFFVVVAPFILLEFNKLKQMGQVILLAICMAVLAVFYTICPIEWRHPLFYINPVSRLVDFIFGIFIAYQYKKIVNSKFIKGMMKACNSAAFLYPTIVVGTLLLSFAIYYNTLLAAYFSPIFWIPCTAILLVCSVCSMKRITIMQKFGAISFEFFMVHQLCMNFITKIQQAGFFTIDNKFAIIVIDFVFALLLAIILHRFFSIPILNKLRAKA